MKYLRGLIALADSLSQPSPTGRITCTPFSPGSPVAVNVWVPFRPLGNTLAITTPLVE